MVVLGNGDDVDLRITARAPVAKRLGDAAVGMLAYIDSLPGRSSNAGGARGRS